MDWLRWYHGTVTDPKFRVVAKKAASEIEGLRVSDVLAVWGMLLERASASEPRGSFAGFDSEAADAAFDLPEGSADAILRALKAKELTKGDLIANWDKRQPKREREDNSTDRVRAFRERKKQAGNTTCDNETPCNATEHQGTPRLEESRVERNDSVSPPTPQGGSGAEPVPPSPEDDPDAQPTPPLTGMPIEFQEIVTIYPPERVDEVPAYKAFMAIRKDRSFSLLIVSDDLEKRKKCPQWQRGVIPNLSRYLREQMWRNPVQSARASPSRDPTAPKTYRQCQDLERRMEAERYGTGRTQHGRTGLEHNQAGTRAVQHAALPGLETPSGRTG